MKNYLLLIVAGLALVALLINGCHKVENLVIEDWSAARENSLIQLSTTNGQQVDAYLSKPPGVEMNAVLILHEEQASLNDSKEATINYALSSEGGLRYLQRGWLVLSLAYSEFEADGSVAHRGAREMEEVIAAIDFLQKDLLQYNIKVNKLIVHGDSRGGTNALIAGIKRKLDAVVATSAVVDWKAHREAIHSATIESSWKERQLFEQSIAEWQDTDESENAWVKYSPGLRQDEFKTPFLIVSGEQNRARLQQSILLMEKEYHICGDCLEGSQFLYYPGGHKDWNQDSVWEVIFGFVGDES